MSDDGMFHVHEHLGTRFRRLTESAVQFVIGTLKTKQTLRKRDRERPRERFTKTVSRSAKGKYSQCSA